MTFDRDGPDWAPKRWTARLTKPEPAAFPWRNPAAVAVYRICPISRPCRRGRWPKSGDHRQDVPEPSLMMPGIIISSIFSEQGKLIFRAPPLQN
jgi:hypothetical protein